MGILDHVLDFWDVTLPNHKKRKPFQTIEIKVKMDCDGCERRVRNSVAHMKGVKSVEVNRKQSKVTVTGHVEPKKVLNKIKSRGKRAEFWAYTPYNLVTYPYAPQAYDKKAPSGYVRNVPQAFGTLDAPDQIYTSIFSDENPNAPCSIM
ncbi:unnamed protein product [Amaranthus hypochondriacus]